MSDYKIVKHKCNWEVQHLYGKHVYCRAFKYRWIANIHMFFKEIGDK